MRGFFVVLLPWHAARLARRRQWYKNEPTTNERDESIQTICRSHCPIRIAPASRHDFPPGYLAGSKAALPSTMGFPHPAGKSCSSGYPDDWFRHSERGGFPIVGLRSRGIGVDQGSSYSIPHVAKWMLGNVTWRLRTVTHLTGFSGPPGADTGWHDVLNPEDCAQPVRNSDGNYPSGRVGRRRTGDSPARHDR